MSTTEKITALPNVVSASATDIIYAVQGGVTGISVQETFQQVLDLGLAFTVLNFAGNPNSNLAGTSYQFCVDTIDNRVYYCSTSGSAASAVWTVFVEGLVNPINGGTGVVSPAARTLPVANGAAAMTFLGPLTNGQFLIGSTGANPVPATLTAGTNITITDGAGTITVNASGSASFSFSDVTAVTQAMAVNSGYVANNAALVDFTLPAVAAFGTRLDIVGNGAGGWKINQNALQSIHIGALTSTIGVGGSVASTNRYNSVSLVCVVANLEWVTWNAPETAGFTIV